MMKNSERLIKGTHYLTSSFGNRVFNGKKEFHNGVDYGTSHKRIPCYAPEDGIVVRISRDSYGANFVYIRFEKLKMVGLYYHLHTVSVKVNQHVKKGQEIGIIGNTGLTSGGGPNGGIHLHFSWIKDNKNALSYYGADYVDYEKYKFPEEEEYMKIKQDIRFDGVGATIEAIELDGMTYIKTRELSKVGIDIQYREETKEIEMNSKIDNVEVLFNGEEKLSLKSREIKGRNYFISTDLEKLGLKVGYTKGTPTIDRE